MFEAAAAAAGVAFCVAGGAALRLALRGDSLGHAVARERVAAVAPGDIDVLCAGGPDDRDIRDVFRFARAVLVGLRRWGPVTIDRPCGVLLNLDVAIDDEPVRVQLVLNAAAASPEVAVEGFDFTMLMIVAVPEPDGWRLRSSREGVVGLRSGPTPHRENRLHRGVVLCTNRNRWAWTVRWQPHYNRTRPLKGWRWRCAGAACGGGTRHTVAAAIRILVSFAVVGGPLSFTRRSEL